MAKIEIESVPEKSGSRYPAPYGEACKARRFRRLGDAAGLKLLGATRCVLPPGAWSSQRHWHSKTDEFVVMLEGEMVLITDGGEEVMRPGDCAAFKAGEQNGHHAQNRSDKDAVFIALSTQDPDDACDYPDIDLKVDATGYQHKDGTPY